MSSKKRIQITCPKCSTEQDVIIWQSVNIQLSPEAKELVLNGELNLFQCESCDHLVRVETSFLYHDMEKGFLAMYYPLANFQALDAITEFDDHGKLKYGTLEKKADKDYNYMDDAHIVFDVEELARYIYFREKLFEVRKLLDGSDGIVKLLA